MVGRFFVFSISCFVFCKLWVWKKEKCHKGVLRGVCTKRMVLELKNGAFTCYISVGPTFIESMVFQKLTNGKHHLLMQNRLEYMSGPSGTDEAFETDAPDPPDPKPDVFQVTPQVHRKSTHHLILTTLPCYLTSAYYAKNSI